MDHPLKNMALQNCCCLNLSPKSVLTTIGIITLLFTFYTPFYIFSEFGSIAMYHKFFLSSYVALLPVVLGLSQFIAAIILLVAAAKEHTVFIAMFAWLLFIALFFQIIVLATVTWVPILLRSPERTWMSRAMVCVHIAVGVLWICILNVYFPLLALGQIERIRDDRTKKIKAEILEGLVVSSPPPPEAPQPAPPPPPSAPAPPTTTTTGKGARSPAPAVAAPLPPTPAKAAAPAISKQEEETAASGKKGAPTAPARRATAANPAKEAAPAPTSAAPAPPNKPPPKK